MGEAAQIAVAFVELIQSVDGAARQQTKIGGVGCNFHVGQGVNDAVEQTGAPRFEKRIAVAVADLSVHHIITFLPLAEEFRYKSYRVLQIAEENQGRIAAQQSASRRRWRFPRKNCG